MSSKIHPPTLSTGQSEAVTPNWVFLAHAQDRREGETYLRILDECGIPAQLVHEPEPLTPLAPSLGLAVHVPDDWRLHAEETLAERVGEGALSPEMGQGGEDEDFDFEAEEEEEEFDDDLEEEFDDLEEDDLDEDDDDDDFDFEDEEEL